jgi:hypothetical protein
LLLHNKETAPKQEKQVETHKPVLSGGLWVAHNRKQWGAKDKIYIYIVNMKNLKQVSGSYLRSEDPPYAYFTHFFRVSVPLKVVNVFCSYLTNLSTVDINIRAEA